MGVHGLWQLLNPCGKTVPLEAMNNKILAVDVSIWLHQAMTGVREMDGSAAALIVLFHRLCKLLFYRIRPVFVFDGGVPAIKRQTMVARRMRKTKARTEATRIRTKLLKNMLKHEALRKVFADENIGAPSSLTSLNLPGPWEEEELYKLPEKFTATPSDSNSESGSDCGSGDAGTLDLDSVDVNSSEFRSLPAELRHDILSDLKETRKQNSWRNIDQMPENSQDFSNFQMNRLLKRRAIQVSLEECGKEMGEKDMSLLELRGMLGNVAADDCQLVTGRIAQDDTARFMLVQRAKTQKSTDEKTTPINVEKLAADLIEKMEKYQSKSETEVKEPSRFSKIDQDIIDVLTGDYSAGGNLKGMVAEKIIEPFLIPPVGLTEKVVDNLAVERDLVKNEAGEIDTDVLTGQNLETKLDGNLPTAAVDIHSESASKFVENLTEDKNSLECKPIDLSNDEESEEETPEKNTLKNKTEKNTLKNEPEKSTLKNEPAEEIAIIAEIAETQTIKTVELVEETATEKPAVTLPEEISENLPCEENPKPMEIIETLDDSDDNDDFIAVDGATAVELSDVLAQERNVLLEDQTRQQRLQQTVTDQIYADAQELLRLFGVPYVVAPMEAEAQCAALEILGLTNGTITDDSDIWLFGGCVVYKDFFNQKKRVRQFRRDDIQRILKLSRDEMVRLAMLVGSDYTTGLAGVGPVTAMEILAAFPPSSDLLSGLRNFREWLTSGFIKGPTRISLKNKLKNTQVIPGFPNDVVAEAYFHPSVDESKEPFSWSKPDLTMLEKYTKIKFGWESDRCKQQLMPVLKKLSETTEQHSILRYIEASATAMPESILSKRVEGAVKNLGRKSDEFEEFVEPKAGPSLDPLMERLHKKTTIPQREKDRLHQQQLKKRAAKILSKTSKRIKMSQPVKTINLSESSSDDD